MTFAQRRNRLTTHFSERTPVINRRVSVHSFSYSGVVEFHGHFEALYCFHPHGKSLWRQHGLPKHQYYSARLYGVVSHCTPTYSIERQILNFWAWVTLALSLLRIAVNVATADRGNMKMILMSFDTEYNRAYDARVVCVESTALNNRHPTKPARPRTNQLWPDCGTVMTKACEKRSVLYSSGNGYESQWTQFEI